MSDQEQQLRADEGRLQDEERDLTAHVHEGQQADQILQHPLVKGALDALEAGAFERWKQTKDNDGEVRERLYLQYQAVQQFRSYFEDYVTNGKMAGARLPKVREERNRLRDRIEALFGRRRAA